MSRWVVTVSLLLALRPLLAEAVDAYCFRPLYLDTPHPLPLKCPPEEWLIYYDCCQGTDQCCPYLKWPNLVLLLIVILGILIGCCCCCGFLICESCKRRNKQKKDPNTAEAQKSPEDECRRPEEPFQHTATYHNFNATETEV